MLMFSYTERLNSNMEEMNSIYRLAMILLLVPSVLAEFPKYFYTFPFTSNCVDCDFNIITRDIDISLFNGSHLQLNVVIMYLSYVPTLSNDIIVIFQKERMKNTKNIAKSQRSTCKFWLLMDH